MISTNNQISNAKELDIETEEDANVSENNGDKIFEIFFFHRGILKKILHKITNFEVWVPEDFLSKWQKS